MSTTTTSDRPATTTATTTPTSEGTNETSGTGISVRSRVPLMLGALLAVVLADAMQIAAGLAEVDPSPPADVLPLLAATALLGVAAIPLIRAADRVGAWLGIACCALSMIGMGPHKLLVEDGMTIAPLALVGFAFAVTFIAAAVQTLRNQP